LFNFFFVFAIAHNRFVSLLGMGKVNSFALGFAQPISKHSGKMAMSKSSVIPLIRQTYSSDDFESSDECESKFGHRELHFTPSCATLARGYPHLTPTEEIRQILNYYDFISN